MRVMPAGTGDISKNDSGAAAPEHEREASVHQLTQAASAPDTAATAPPPGKKATGSRHLRRMLVLTDNIALLGGWVGTSLIMWAVADLNRPLINWALVMALGIALSQIIMRGRSLYLSRVTTIRAVEAAKVTTSLAAATVLTYLVLSPFGLQRTVTGYEIYAIFLASALLVVAGRGFYQNWLTRCRAEGRYAREVLVLGTNEKAKDLIDVLENNPGLGYKVAGVLGYPGEAAVVGIDVNKLLVGSIENAEHHIRTRGTEGVIVVESALDEADRQRLVRLLLDLGVHVQITGGVRGVDQRRVRAHPLADSALMYLEPARLHRWQLVFKRTLDVAVSGAVLVVTSPLILLGAVAVKLYDFGPSFERLDRTDGAGRSYGVWTLRTTVRKSKLAELGEEAMYAPRSLWSDPYRTPVGRILEATCINELAQLSSVLLGHTSLVGHRASWAGDPEVPTNSAHHMLRPGLTGLWRVETRYSAGHNDFLDQYYVENWSVTLDLVILLATVDKLLLRLVHGESWRRRAAKPVELKPSAAAIEAELTSLAS